MKTTAEDILKKVRAIFLSNEIETKLSEVTTEDGAVIYFDGELALGTPVYFIQEGENVPVPVGEYMLAGGAKLIVNEAGIVGDLIPAAAEETAEATPPMAAPETTLSEEDVSKLIENALKPLQEKIVSLTDEKKELEAKLSKEPAAEPIATSPEGKETPKGVTLKKSKVFGAESVYNRLWS